MNKLIYSVLFLLFQCGSYCQEIKDNKIDSSFIHSFSLGWSNPLSYISTNMTNSSYNDSIFGILIDYQFLDEKKTINRFHLKFSPFYLNSNLTMSNFLISYTKGRTIHHKNKINFFHGLGAYYKCNIYRNKQVTGIPARWSSDYYGLGLEYYWSLDYLLKNNFFATILMTINLGFHQDYDPTIFNNNNSQEYWTFKTANQQIFSLAIKKML